MKICILSCSALADEMAKHAKTVLEAVCKKNRPELTFCHWQPSQEETESGVPSRETVDLCRTSDAVLFCLERSGVCDKNYLELLRLKLGLFGSMRPVRIFPSLSSCSTVKDPTASGMNCFLVQEEWSDDLLPEQGEKVINGDLCGYDVLLANSQTAQLTAQTAFHAAMKRRKKLICADLCEKMSSASLRRRVINLAASDFPEIELTRLSAAQICTRLVSAPGSFDVVLADPLLGNLLFSGATAITGVPNLQCAACFGYGKQGLYYNAAPLLQSGENEDSTCPVAVILAMAMALRHSLNLEKEAQCIEKAVEKVLSLGRTADIHQLSLPVVSASVFTAYIAQTAAEYIASAG